MREHRGRANKEEEYIYRRGKGWRVPRSSRQLWFQRYSRCPLPVRHPFRDEEWHFRSRKPGSSYLRARGSRAPENPIEGRDSTTSRAGLRASPPERVRSEGRSSQEDRQVIVRKLIVEDGSRKEEELPKENEKPSGGEREEESKEPRGDRSPREGRVVNVIQQSALIVNGRRVKGTRDEGEARQRWL